MTEADRAQLARSRATNEVANAAASVADEYERLCRFGQGSHFPGNMHSVLSRLANAVAAEAAACERWNAAMDAEHAEYQRREREARARYDAHEWEVPK